MQQNDSRNSFSFCLFSIFQFLISDEAMQSSAGVMQRSGAEMENSVYQKARSREEYMNYVTKLILHCKSEYMI